MTKTKTMIVPPSIDHPDSMEGQCGKEEMGYSSTQYQNIENSHVESFAEENMGARSHGISLTVPFIARQESLAHQCTEGKRTCWNLTVE